MPQLYHVRPPGVASLAQRATLECLPRRARTRRIYGTVSVQVVEKGFYLSASNIHVYGGVSHWMIDQLARVFGVNELILADFAHIQHGC
jgi:tRNA A37 threonylcarbamoyladenosine dehydratase